MTITSVFILRLQEVESEIYFLFTLYHQKYLEFQ